MASIKYRSSDRTHLKLPRWTKAERAEWEGQLRDDAKRVMEYISRGDMRNAFAALLQMERIEAFGISAGEHIDARRAFLNNLPILPNP